jgi:phage baseplate assembly protein W
MAAKFIGVSTVGRSKAPFTLTDADLVKQDLLNAFSIRRGEMMGKVDYGTIIHDIMMDPLDDYSKALILEDVERIIAEEPRVQRTGGINLTDYENGIRIEISLYFVLLDTEDLLYLDFKRKNSNFEG